MVPLPVSAFQTSGNKLTKIIGTIRHWWREYGGEIAGEAKVTLESVSDSGSEEGV